MNKKFPNKARVAQYNVGDGPDDIKLEDLETLLEKDRPDIYTLDETADRLKVLKAFVKRHPEFDFWNGDGRPGAAKTAVVYRIALGELTGKFSDTLVGARHLPNGAGPENASPKVDNRIRMRVNGTRIHFIAAHQYASVKRRRAAARAFVKALVDLIKHRFGVVVVGGDMNELPLARLYRALRELLPFFSDAGPTHGNRLIDIIWTNRRARIVEVWTRALSSDHKAVIADIIF